MNESSLTAHSSRQSKHRALFRVRHLIIGSAVVLTATGIGWHLYQSWYASQNSHLVIYQVLHNSIKNGDGIAAVQGLIGHGEVVKDSSLPAQVTVSHTDHYPQGVHDGDIFLLYALRDGRDKLYLQFRDGHLVNHVPDDYAKYPDTLITGLF